MSPSTKPTTPERISQPTESAGALTGKQLTEQRPVNQRDQDRRQQQAHAVDSLRAQFAPGERKQGRTEGETQRSAERCEFARDVLHQAWFFAEGAEALMIQNKRTTKPQLCQMPFRPFDLGVLAVALRGGAQRLDAPTDQREGDDVADVNREIEETRAVKGIDVASRVRLRRARSRAARRRTKPMVRPFMLEPAGFRLRRCTWSASARRRRLEGAL